MKILREGQLHVAESVICYHSSSSTALEDTQKRFLYCFIYFNWEGGEGKSGKNSKKGSHRNVKGGDHI